MAKHHENAGGRSGGLPRVKRWLQRGSLLLAVGYLAGLVAAALALRFVGERWWPTTALLYMPRIGFALPLPVVVLALLAFGPRRLLWTMPVAICLVLFPLMGLKLGMGGLLSSDGAGDDPRVTVLSYNVAMASRPEEVAAVIRAADADIVLIQEYSEAIEAPLAETWKGFHRHTEGQFSIASRFPVGDVYLPPKLPFPDSPPRSARFVRYRVDSPLGPLRVINMHPVSPRLGLEEARGSGLLHEIAQGRLDRLDHMRTLELNAALRTLQAETVIAEAERSPNPLLIAGDTNLPDLSWTFGRTLARYTDGFDAVGQGFGYTFPSHRPWMRIDRILVDDHLVFHRFETRGGRASDHLAVYAVVGRR